MSRVDLSSLNRAALSAKEGYWWINAAGLALSMLIAKMSFSAYDAEDIDKAWICVTCQGLAIALAIIARRALTGQMGFSALLAGASAGGCAWWASHGLALAWAENGDPANAWMVFFLTALEPGVFLLAEHVKEGREALRIAQEQANQETAEALAAARAKDEANRTKPPAQPASVRGAGESATVHRLKLVEGEHGVADRPAQRVEASVLAADIPADAEALRALTCDTEVKHSERTFANAEDHARHLITAEGVRHRNELSRRVRGLSTYRAALLLDELAPDWRRKRTATKA